VLDIRFVVEHDARVVDPRVGLEAGVSLSNAHHEPGVQSATPQHPPQRHRSMETRVISEGMTGSHRHDACDLVRPPRRWRTEVRLTSDPRRRDLHEGVVQPPDAEDSYEHLHRGNGERGFDEQAPARPGEPAETFDLRQLAFYFPTRLPIVSSNSRMPGRAAWSVKSG
jgi:hypothetical protein